MLSDLSAVRALCRRAARRGAEVWRHDRGRCVADSTTSSRGEQPVLTPRIREAFGTVDHREKEKRAGDVK